MKYKIKLEVNYEDLEKDIIRDHKLKLLEKDVTTELVSDYPLHIPNKEDGIFLGDEQYTIEKINHTIEKECYTTTILIYSQELKNYSQEKRMNYEMLLIKKILK